MNLEDINKSNGDRYFSKELLYEGILKDILNSENPEEMSAYQKIDIYLREDFILEQEMKGRPNAASRWIESVEFTGSMHRIISELYALYHSEMIRGDIPEGHDEREVAWDIVKNRVEDLFETEMS